MSVALHTNTSKRLPAGVAVGTNTLTTPAEYASTVQTFSEDGINFKSIISIKEFSKAISSDAALGFGQKILDFPTGVIKIEDALLSLNLSTPTGLSATAGEIGLGTVVASGAVAVLSGTSTFEDVLTGKTISNLVAGTPATETTSAATGAIFDGSSTAKDLYVNIASTWDQTAAESITISGTATVFWRFLGSDFTGGV